jgi:hypothetical protein
MTSAALSWGSALLAFGPSAALLFLIVYQKAQLVIVVTTSAFAFLVASLFASFVWWIFNLMGLQHPLLVLFPGVISQFLMRCVFVHLYHKVEKVIQISIARHEEEQQQRQQSADATNTTQEWTETARLRLELNDWACGLAAGNGFGGMHAILLYGTLLASESGNVGTLYQPSCPNIPGLVVSAFNAFLFAILDLAWMLFTFFGMRVRASGLEESTVTPSFGSYFGNSRKSGTIVLAFVLVTHLAASFATLPNYYNGGCRVSFPLLALITVGTLAAFRVGVSNIYLPPGQRRRMVGEEHHD